MVITKECLFQWNIEQVITRIKRDYSEEIMQSYEENKNVETFEDWLNYNPQILGMYMLEQLSNNFDFENK